jgi:major membrane immunogen (membrane-anchored lipoprotein)
MKYLFGAIVACFAMVGCVSTDNLNGTYKIGYEDRGDKDDRWSVEPGLEAVQDDGSSVGISYRYREEDKSDNEEHGVFVQGKIPLSGVA